MGRHGPLRALEQGFSAGGQRGLPGRSKRGAVALRGAKGLSSPLCGEGAYLRFRSGLFYIVRQHRDRKRTVQGRRPGEVRQRTTDSIVPFLSIARLVKQIADDINSEESDPDRKIRFQKDAIYALRDGAEHHLNILFQSALFGAIHAKRVTLQDTDIRLVKNIAEMHGIKVYQPWDKQQSMNMLQKRMTHSLS